MLNDYLNKLVQSAQTRFLFGITLLIIFYVFGQYAIANTLIILLVLNWLLTKDTPKELLIRLQNKETWFFLTIFIITLLGAIYSEDLKIAWKFVEMRLTMLLIPLMVLSTKISKKIKETALLTFVYTCLAASLVGVIYSFYLFYHTGDSGYFYNDNLVILIDNQAVYFSLYLNICLLIIHWYLKKNNSANKIMWLIVSAVLLIIIFLLASRVSIIVSILLLVYFIFDLFIEQKNLANISKVAFNIIGLLLLLGFLFPKTVKRFQSIATHVQYDFSNSNDVDHFNGVISDENWNSLTIRLALWECAFELIKENPVFGVGTGDYDKAFRLKIEEKNFIYAMKQNFGVHNQYLYFAISTGIVGLFFILIALAGLLINGIKEQNYLYFMILVVFMVAFLTENILNRYMGVLSFILLTTLAFRKPYDD